MKDMKIGIFDSGLGGLLIAKSLMSELPQYDYVYLGDVKRVPYGDRSHEVIYEFLEESVEFLLKRGCKLVIVACNTASAHALRKIQQEYLPRIYPDRKVLGVIIPACEEALVNPNAKRIGVIATSSTVNSGSFPAELRKLRPSVQVIQQAAPLLVPLIENDSVHLARPLLEEYLAPFKGTIDALILGCTHYPILKNEISAIVGDNVRIISQNELLPEKLRSYLSKHSEIDSCLGKGSHREFLVTDMTDAVMKSAKGWFGDDVVVKQVDL